MTDNIKIIQDMSLLYELSLAVGSSLDPHKNCEHFLRTLIGRKNLAYASVWLINQEEDQHIYELFYRCPSNTVSRHQIHGGHPIYVKLLQDPYLSITSNDPDMELDGLKKESEKGMYAIFRLGHIGFLKLFAAGRENGFPAIELEQLRQVIDKFTISLEGSLSHSRLQDEIENRKFIQKTLRRVNDRYSDLFNNMYDALIVLDTDGNVKESNKAAKKLLGYEPDENPRVNVKDIIHPDDLKRAIIHMQHLKRDGYYSGFTGRVITIHGEIRFVEVNSNAIYDENGTFIGSRDIVRDVTEQKKGERRVRESEATLRQVIDYSLDAVVAMDDKGLVTEWSQQAENMFGFSREEALGNSLADMIIPPEYRKAHDMGMEHFRRTGEGPVLNKRIEISALRKNGETFPVELSISVLTNDDGYFFSGFIRDITDRKESEEQLQNAQVRLTNLIKNLQAGVLLENENRKILLTNRYFCNVFGLEVKPDDLIGKPCSQVVNSSAQLFSYPDIFLADVEDLIAKKQLKTGELMHTSDGRILERDFIPLFSGEKYLGHLWQYRDVTEKHKAQQAIRDSEEKYRSIMENMELGLLEVDNDHRIIRPYKAFCNMMGYKSSELVGKNALDLFVADTHKKQMMVQDARRAKGQTGVYEMQLRKKDGSLMWALISGAPILDRKGNVVGSIGIHYDLTERKELEQDLERAKRVAEQARLAERQFLANMSHEIRTPMNAVIGMSHLLYDTKLTATQKDYLDSLRFSADSLMDIINNILDFSKTEAGELEFEEKKFNLRLLMEGLHRTFQYKMEEKNIEILLEFDPKIKNYVIGDHTRLNQILTNLLGNASKFTTEGTIRMSAKLRGNTPDLYVVEFTVQDTGIGIADNKLATIFENFKQADVEVTRKYGGTGLGLTIVKQLVEMQDGSIRVKSEPGKGSSFIVTLPLKNAGIEAPEEKVAEREIRTPKFSLLKGLQILVVEDNLMNQKLITKVLDIWECDYQLANNGLEAIQASQEKLYDLILMDIHMPEMGGVEATKKIREDNRNLNQGAPIVALTAAALLEEKNRALGAGMNDFLTKPFAPRMLESCILHQLGKAEKHPDIPDKESQNGNSTPSEQDINLEYLFNFSNGDRAFVLDIIDTFLKETPGELDRLVADLDKEDWEQVYKTIHKLKPSFMMFSLEEEHRRASDICLALKTNAFEKAEMVSDVNWLITAALKLLFVLDRQHPLL